MATIDQLMVRTEELSRPCLRLASSRHTEGSFLGGIPDLPDDVSWPTWKGAPLGFVAQIDLDEAPKDRWPDWMPREGRLLVFYDAEQSTWGHRPDERGGWRVVYTTSSAAAEVQVPDALPDHARLNRKNLELYPDVSRPSLERVLADQGMSLADAEAQAFGEAYYGGSAGSAGYRHQLFGLPDPIQADTMETDCEVILYRTYFGEPPYFAADSDADILRGAQDWELLIQLDSDDDVGMMWGDVGMLYFWIRRQDAERRDFSRVWMRLQCA